MNLDDAQQKAEKLLAIHNLSDWTFGFDRAKTRLGCCWYGKKMITLSRPLTEINDEEVVTQTILHEIAHVLAGHENKHNRIWKETLIRIGGNGKVRYHTGDIQTSIAKYTITCPQCAIKHKAHKKRMIACKACCQKYNNGRFSRQFLFSFSVNHAKTLIDK